MEIPRNDDRHALHALRTSGFLLRSAMFTPSEAFHRRLKMYRRIRCSTVQVQLDSDLELLQCLEITFVHKSAGSFAQKTREKPSAPIYTLFITSRMMVFIVHLSYTCAYEKYNFFLRFFFVANLWYYILYKYVNSTLL